MKKMASEIRVLTIDGKVVVLDGPVGWQGEKPIWDAVYGACKPAYVRVLDRGQQGRESSGVDELYGCRVIYSWRPGSLKECGDAFRAIGVPMDGRF